MTRFMVALAIGTAAIGGAALAQEGPGGGGNRGGMGLMRADTNGDGVITRAEYQAQVDERFARIDANGNGKIDEDEGFRRGGRRGPGDAPPPPAPPVPPAGAAPAAPPPPSPGRMAGMTRDQFRSAAMARFDRFDANHDGKIDRAELAAMPMRGPGTPPPPRP